MTLPSPSFLSLLAIPLALSAACSEGPMVDLEDNGDKADQADPLSIELTEKYGLRPRRYTGFFNGSNEAEQRFGDHLPTVTDFLNDRGAELGVELFLTDAQLAVNFISEGGFFLLDQNLTDSDYDIDNLDPDNDFYLDGFSYLGVDTFADNLEALSPWIPPELARAIDDGEVISFAVTNELGQEVNSIVVQTIEQGLEANATVLAWSRSLLQRDLEELYGLSLGDIGAEARFFWTTMYFNAGTGFGRGQLAAHGADYWKTRWTGPDDHATQSRFARYNTLWRTSTWEYLERTEFSN